MSLDVPIKDVQNPQHVEIYGETFTNAPVRMEVYTGVIVISANVRQLDPLRDQVVSFLPMPANVVDGKKSIPFGNMTRISRRSGPRSRMSRVRRITTTNETSSH